MGRVDRGLKPHREPDAEYFEQQDSSGKLPPIKKSAKKKVAKKTAKKKAKKKATKPAKKRKRTSEEREVLSGAAGKVAVKLHDYDDQTPRKKKKKPTKKQKEVLAQWAGDDRSRHRDALFSGVADLARTKFGHSSVHVAKEADKLVVGIPMPTIAREWLIQQNVLPLSVVYVIVGKWATCKSAFLYEVFRWFAKFNGGAILKEVETKFSPDLCSSIMGYSSDEIKPIIVNRCTSCEEWQDMLTFYLKHQKRLMVGTQKDPGPGRTIPVAFGVDSVMGKAAEEAQKKVDDDGHGGRGFAIEALSIAKFMRASAHKFDNWPFALFLVNHLKEKKDESTGRVELTMPGGDFSSFQESFELHTSVWREKIDTEGFDGVGVRIKCKKNGLGIKNRQVRTRMLWWEEWNEELEEYQQKTVWDWDWATTALLYDLPGKYKTRLKELDFDIQFKSPDANVECFAQSKALGMGKDQWETFADVGKMIRENTEVMELLRTALFIKRRALMKGDYLEQLDTMLGEME